MGERRFVGRTRREALTAVVAAGGLAMLGSVRAGASTDFVQRSAVGGGGGIAGGGVVKTTDGEAQFSLFATRLMVEGEEPVVFGRVQWVDPSWHSQGVRLESTEVTSYGPPPDNAEARELRGLMTADGAGSYPFVLRAFDGGLPGDGQDTVRLVVGAEATAGTPAAGTPLGDFAYTVEGTVINGDLALLSFDTPNQG